MCHVYTTPLLILLQSLGLGSLGVTSLLRAAQQKKPRLTHKMVQFFLLDEDFHTLQCLAPKTHAHCLVLVSWVPDQFQADLVDMQEWA